MDYFSELWTKYQVQILVWCGLGLVVGIVAKYIMPGKDKGGLLSTALLGIAGSFLGGFIGNYLGLGTASLASGINLITILTALAGALVLLLFLKVFRFLI